MPYKSYSLLKRNPIPFLSLIVGVVLLLTLLYFVRPATIIESFKKITLAQFGLIILLKLGFMILGALKWKVILDFYNQKVSISKLYFFKFATFSVSFFTPMAAVGGQAVGVVLLKNERVPVKIGVATMLIDSVLTPFISIIISLLAVLIFLLTKFSDAPVFILGVAILFSIVLFSVLFFIAFKIKRTDIKNHQNGFLLKWKVVIYDFLITFSDFFRENKKGTLFLVILILLGHAAVLFEIFLILYFLDVGLGVIEIALIEAGFTFAFVIPISQALGVAEMSGAYFLNLLGYSATLGVSLTLILRARHLLVGLIGVVVLISYGLIKLRFPFRIGTRLREKD
jgi:uncharacterized protein (TIRG00374 family)